MCLINKRRGEKGGGRRGEYQCICLTFFFKIKINLTNLAQKIPKGSIYGTAVFKFLEKEIPLSDEFLKNNY